MSWLVRFVNLVFGVSELLKKGFHSLARIALGRSSSRFPKQTCMLLETRLLFGLQRRKGAGLAPVPGSCRDGARARASPTQRGKAKK